MSDGAAVDTDVLLKAAALRMAAECGDVLKSYGRPMALGLTHLIAARQMARKRGVRDIGLAQAELAALLGTLGRLEPDELEIMLAAEFASVAQAKGLPLDAGEAQLAAIVVKRGLPLLVTGDKRAIGALADLTDGTPTRDVLVGRLACFEQVVAAIAGLVGAKAVRDKICAEPEVDGGMRLACSCGQAEWDPGQLGQACESFVGDVRKRAGILLLAGSALA
ncbi:hypothetical protein U1872_12785 [Sphingomonas sp. RB3P16]|uniref:hypothetical protein n=1 Tax=Parasphingomonas frigoris TaxID=3096163 RepID=UPI002FCBD91A